MNRIDAVRRAAVAAPTFRLAVVVVEATTRGAKREAVRKAREVNMICIVCG